MMAYGRKSGVGGYKLSWDMMEGARVLEIKVDENGDAEVETWIRTGDGNKYIEDYKEVGNTRPPIPVCSNDPKLYDDYCHDIYI